MKPCPNCGGKVIVWELIKNEEHYWYKCNQNFMDIHPFMEGLIDEIKICKWEDNRTGEFEK